MLMNPNMGFGVFLLEKPKTFSTMMIMEFRIIIHLEQQGRIYCLCQQEGKRRAQHEGVVGLPCLDMLQVQGCSRKKILKDPLQMQDLLPSFVWSAHFGCMQFEEAARKG
ncbi:hypothetical protein COP2_044814 [Malus domestica]